MQDKKVIELFNKSYPTPRLGWISDYRGIVVFDGELFVSVPVSGTAYTVSREGYVEVYDLASLPAALEWPTYRRLFQMSTEEAPLVAFFAGSSHMEEQAIWYESGVYPSRVISPNREQHGRYLAQFVNRARKILSGEVEDFHITVDCFRKALIAAGVKPIRNIG